MRIPHRLYLLATFLPLLLLVCLPSVRLPAHKLALNWRNANSNTGYIPVPEYLPRTEDVLKRNPEAIDGQVWALSRGSFPTHLKKFERDAAGNRRSDGKLLAFAELARTDPRNPWLLAQGVIQSGGPDGRVAGPWESNWHMNMYGTESFERARPNSLSKVEVAAGLDLARRGQQLEPQNTLFDWMEARFLFAQRRDEEATQVLVEASRKTKFDMHWRKDWQASVWAMETSGLLLPEEKVFAGFGTLLPHIGQLRHVTKMGLWIAMQKEEAGDPERALEIQGALARLNVIRLERSFFADELLGAAEDLQCVWRAPKEMQQARSFYGNKFRPLPVPPGSVIPPAVLPPQASFSPETNLSPLYGVKPRVQLVTLFDGLSETVQSRAQTANSDASAFARHCLHGNRPDLAEQAKRDALLLKDSFLRFDTNQTRDAFMSYLTGGAMTELALWWFAAEVGVQLLVTSIIAYVLLAALQAVIWRKQASRSNISGRQENFSAFRLNPRLVTYPLFLGLASSVVITACGTLLICHEWVGQYDFGHIPFSGERVSALTCNYVASSFPTILGLLATLVTLVFAKRYSERIDLLQNGIRSLRTLQAWEIPASLWWILVCIWVSASPRQIVDEKWHSFLQSENQAPSSQLNP